jgi:hypothetical protein
MLTWLLFTTLVIAILAPESQAGKMLRELLIDLPTRLLAKLTLVRILFGVLVISSIAGPRFRGDERSENFFKSTRNTLLRR